MSLYRFASTAIRNVKENSAGIRGALYELKCNAKMLPVVSSIVHESLKQDALLSAVINACHKELTEAAGTETLNPHLLLALVYVSTMGKGILKGSGAEI